MEPLRVPAEEEVRAAARKGKDAVVELVCAMGRFEANVCYFFTHLGGKLPKEA